MASETTPEVAPLPSQDWIDVHFQVPVAWKRVLDEIAHERAISFSALARMIFREFLKPRLEQ